MDEKTIEKYSKETPLGWKVNLLNMLATSLMCLAESIDNDLHKIRFPDGGVAEFNKDKKLTYKRFCLYLQDAIRQYKLRMDDAARQYDKLDIDGQVWRIVGASTTRYDNFTADAKELLQLMLLYVDRAHSDTGFYSIFRFMRSLPEGGIFPESEIEKFQFKRPIILGPGAPVVCQFGKGIIRDQMNGDNWLIDMDGGGQRILTSKQFTLSL